MNDDGKSDDKLQLCEGTYIWACELQRGHAGDCRDWTGRLFKPDPEPIGIGAVVQLAIRKRKVQ